MGATPISTQNFRPGGNSTTLDVTAAAVIKASPGVIFRVIVVIVGTGGSLTINDLATTSGGAAANQIITIPFGSLTIGQVITLEAATVTGIAVTAVPTGGSQFTITWS
jgi:hypothetical protein